MVHVVERAIESALTRADKVSVTRRDADKDDDAAVDDSIGRASLEVKYIF